MCRNSANALPSQWVLSDQLECGLLLAPNTVFMFLVPLSSQRTAVMQRVWCCCKHRVTFECLHKPLERANHSYLGHASRMSSWPVQFALRPITLFLGWRCLIDPSPVTEVTTVVHAKSWSLVSFEGDRRALPTTVPRSMACHKSLRNVFSPFFDWA